MTPSWPSQTIVLKWPEPLTDDALLALSLRNPGYRLERESDGDLLVTPPTGFNTGRRNAALIAQLHLWNERTGAGVVCDSSTGFSLRSGALYSPDAAWVSLERLSGVSAAERETFLPLSPDVVFELCSPSDVLSNMRAKAGKFIENGTLVAVVLDPASQTVEIRTRGGVTTHRAPVQPIEIFNPIPRNKDAAFVLVVAKIFAI